eukprot:g37.t1
MLASALALGLSALARPSIRQWPQSVPSGASRYTAVGATANADPQLIPTIGAAVKHPHNPLAVQDKPWEARCDNSYPNVEHDPSDPLGAWRLWYGCFIVSYGGGQGSHRQNAWLYANSSDGLAWTKPNLGKLDLSKLKDPKPASFNTIKTANNVVLGNSDGMGIFRDHVDPDGSRAFKAFGTGCFGADALTECVSGTAVSADGLHFKNATELKWPAPQRYDDHQNLHFDEMENRYMLTTRDYTSGSGRDIGIVRSTEEGPAGWGKWAATAENVEQGNNDHQLYSQITFQFYDIYLGLVMVFDTASAASYGHGTVHCRLSWSKDSHKWAWVDKGGLTGEPLIPLGSMSTDPAKNEFDSHITFASAFPIVMPDDKSIRLYYAGGNGPHNGARNTSLGLVTFRPDGLLSMSGTGNMTTVAVACTGAQLVVTVDILAPGGSVAVGMDSGDVGVAQATAITANATDHPVSFKGGADFSAHVGKDVSLVFELRGASVFTFGFQ